MSSELPPAQEPHDPGEIPLQGQLDPSSMPGSSDFVGPEDFRYKHIPGYADDVAEVRILNGTTITGVIGMGVAILSECIIDHMEADTPVDSSLYSYLEIGHNTTNITAILGALLITVSTFRRMRRLQRIHKTFDIQ